MAKRAVTRCATADDTRALGRRLALVAQGGDRIALIGPLGAGKTELAKGFAAGLGVLETVDSPSFTLMAEYHGRLPLFHLDLYRLEGVADAFDGGLLDEREADGVTIIEWGDRLASDVDPDRLEVHIDVGLDDVRTIEVIAATVSQARFVAAVADGPGSVAPAATQLPSKAAADH
jgi:tRNA threonylcarbamoyladenosine biosynthesis protein TsaE